MLQRDDPAVTRFVQAATAFCDLMDSRTQVHESWAQQMLPCLAELYAATHRLPDVAPDEFGAPVIGAFDVSPEEWQQVYDHAARMLGRDRRYWAYFDPSAPAEKDELILGDVADDLADIYGDIRPSLRAWETLDAGEEELAAIIWDWKNPSFATHWGRHAANAIRALHSLVLAHGVGEDTIGAE